MTQDRGGGAGRGTISEANLGLSRKLKNIPNVQAKDRKQRFSFLALAGRHLGPSYLKTWSSWRPRGTLGPCYTGTIAISRCALLSFLPHVTLISFCTLSAEDREGRG
eukprot:g35297.t1